jgi:hypothetical protein
LPVNITKKDSLSLSISRYQHILKPTKCPTKKCKECKIKYIDKLGLEIFVICNCKCHRHRQNIDKNDLFHGKEVITF